jgi:CheY-like chemotaxis protein
MLTSVMKFDVDLVLDLDPDLGRTRVDATQITQAIINLALNARDASPEHGSVTIRTANAELDDVDAKRYAYPVRRGSYVLLSVHDAGPALEPDDLEHIFEPFYTMKRPGAGSGLGLSTVYGIVKQSEGYVWVESAPGAGTTFRVYLPRVSRDAERVRARIGDLDAPATETLLLVEDEDAVRNLARRILTRHGYEVIEARNGLEALAMCAGHTGEIHLVVTDVVMPGMGGGELARRLETARPGVPVMLMSGYTDDEIVRHGIAEAREWFLEKPFSPDALLRKVRDVRSGGD